MFGERFRVSIFGESHGPAIGCSIEGCPKDFELDLVELQRFLDRRAPGKDELSTPRKEADKVKFLSGVRSSNILEGTTVAAIIENTNTKSSDYQNLTSVPRPGHADYAARLKYGSHMNLAGGGPFSGRLTAPLCIAGGIAKQILNRHHGTEITTTIEEIGGYLVALRDPKKVILEAKKAKDSVGGIVKCMIHNFPAGVGGPLFEGLESKIAQAVFAIPAVKGLEFGIGFKAAKLRGSQNNDEFYLSNDSELETIGNYSGGLLGGISSGLGPITFNVAFKPTPSIARKQMSVDLKSNKQVDLEIKGRHDPCIVFRALPVVEAVAAIALYNSLLMN